MAYATYNVTDWELYLTNCPTFDQRGNLRPNSATCDIGAFEGAPVPLELGSVTLNTITPDEELDDGFSYPGVTDVPIIDIPIEKLTGDTFNAPEAAPLGSFPLGSFPIGSFDLRASPIGSFPLGSFPIGSFPIGSFPLGSFPLSSIPLLTEGGWTEILNDIPELAGAPLQLVTLEQLLTLNPLPQSIADVTLRNLSIEGSPLASLSLPGLSLGDTTVAELDDWAQNADPAGAEEVCDDPGCRGSHFHRLWRPGHAARPGSQGRAGFGTVPVIPAAGFVPDRLVPDWFIPDWFIPTGFIPAGFVPDRLIPDWLVPDWLIPVGFIPDRLIPAGFFQPAGCAHRLVPDRLVPDRLVPAGFV